MPSQPHLTPPPTSPACLIQMEPTGETPSLCRTRPRPFQAWYPLYVLRRPAAFALFGTLVL
jgi:hypothetical protein